MGWPKRLGGNAVRSDAWLPISTFLASWAFYFGAASLRHHWLQSSSWDFGIFDQAVFLISRGEPPFSTFLGFHILGDHAAFVLYPLALLAKLFPTGHLLFAVQSAALASAVFPFHALGVQRGLSRSAVQASLAVLLLYPVVFNTAIFDFHPETLAFPLIAQVILLLHSQGRSTGPLVLLLLAVVLTCKVTLTFLVLGIGAWLWLLRRRRLAVAVTLLAMGWLLVVGGLVIPAFGGEAAQLTRHFSKFGLEPGAAIQWDLLGAGAIARLFNRLVSLQNLGYLILLLSPVAYLLVHAGRQRLLLGLVPFAPLLLLNLLAEQPALKDLVHHYSLFLVPFLVNQAQLTLIPGPQGLQGYPTWLRRRIIPAIVTWSLLSFLVLSRIGFFFGPFQESLDNAPQARLAMKLVKPEAALLASNALAAQLARRSVVDLIREESVENLQQFDQVLLNRRHPGWPASPELVRQLSVQLEQDPGWLPLFAEEDVVLFGRRITSQAR